MKSSVKGLLSFFSIVIAGTITYYIWREDRLKDIEKNRFLNIKSWNKIKWNDLVILGLWSEQSLQLVKYSGVYFVSLSNDKYQSSIIDARQRYSGKDIITYLVNKNSLLEGKDCSKAFTYLGDKTMVEKVQRLEKNSFILEINSSLQKNLWWFHEKDPTGKIVFFLDKEIIGVFQLKGSLIGNQIKLNNVLKLQKFKNIFNLL